MRENLRKILQLAKSGYLKDLVKWRFKVPSDLKVAEVDRWTIVRFHSYMTEEEVFHKMLAYVEKSAELNAECTWNDLNEEGKRAVAIRKTSAIYDNWHKTEDGWKNLTSAAEANMPLSLIAWLDTKSIDYNDRASQRTAPTAKGAPLINTNDLEELKKKNLN